MSAAATTEAASRFNFGSFNFDYDPYPVGVCRGFIEPDFYRRLVENYPAADLFGTFPDGKSHKKALSELYRPEVYHDFIRRTPVYLDLYTYLKSRRFVDDVLGCFERNQIKTGLVGRGVVSSMLPLKGPLCAKFEKWQRRWHWHSGKRLRTRFEFAALPSDGGSIRPHTDTPSKLITLVVSILREGDWNPSWKGGTEILRPKDIRRNYNFVNDYLEFDECETLRTIDYVPNQCVLFLKTFNSLHCVAPLQDKTASTYRRTLTINIETA